MHIETRTLDDLMMEVLTRLLKTNNVNTASRGDTSELVGVLLTLKNPRARLSNTERKGKVFSALGELLWYLAGRNDLDFIEYYLRRYREEAESDGTLFGAYGPRLFAMRGNNQLKNVESLLRNSPSTRRAVVQFFDADDIRRRRTEIPCTLNWQFILRNSCLNMCTSMRSNDAFLGLPHDIFAFTMIQELLACSLGVGLGTYQHFVGSLHLYERNRDDAIEYVDEGWQPTKAVAMPEMNSIDPWADVNSLLEVEEAIRLGEEFDLRSFNLKPYWADLARLLQVFHYVKTEQKRRIPAVRRRMASNIYDPFIERREPQGFRMRSNQQMNLNFGPESNVPVPGWLESLIGRLVDSCASCTERNTGIIPWACPVPVFGDIVDAQIATAGINPSNLEFTNDKGRELENNRRLETLASLGISSWAHASEQEIRAVCVACLDYFRNNPYKRWFRELDELFSGVGASYFAENDPICHLDLVPFATRHKWTELSPSKRTRLYAASQNAIDDLLRNSSVRVLLLNGSTVIKEMQQRVEVKLRRRTMKAWTLPRKNGDGVKGYAFSGCVTQLQGKDLGREVHILGFNHNIQSSFGVTTKVKRSIGRWLERSIGEILV